MTVPTEGCQGTRFLAIDEPKATSELRTALKHLSYHSSAYATLVSRWVRTRLGGSPVKRERARGGTVIFHCLFLST